MIGTLIKQVGEYRRNALMTPFFTAMEVVMDVLIPYAIARLIDLGITAGNMNQVYLYGGIMLVMALMSLFFGVQAGRNSAVAGAGFAANLRSAMYKNIQTFSFADIDKYSASGLVTRMTTDVSNLQNAFQMLLRVAVRAPFRLVLSIIMCLLIDVRMSLIFLTAMVVLSLAIAYIVVHVGKLFTRVFEQYDRLNASVQENVTAIRVVKASVREEYETNKFNRAAEGLYRLYLRTESLMAANHPIMNMVMYCCIIALSWFGARYIVEGTLTTGQLTSLFTYVMSILSSLMMLSMIFVNITSSTASVKRVSEVIEQQTAISNPPSPLTTVADGSISFRNVSFAYGNGSGEDALSDISFDIKSGETIGVIGGTGSGKSSMVSLISRLYDSKSGSVLVGGEDVRNYDLDALRSAVAIVLQKSVLFSGTVLDNLRWGNPDATEEECRQACRMAQADEFISEMPEGYHSHIEQSGTNISGGQKQRLSIARALVRKPKILILDDSTSACDTATDARIQTAIRTQLPQMTRIIIAQRISSVEHCDRIIVMEKGKISGFGTHDELLKSNQLYREIRDLSQME